MVLKIQEELSQLKDSEIFLLGGSIKHDSDFLEFVKSFNSVEAYKKYVVK